MLPGVSVLVNLGQVFHALFRNCQNYDFSIEWLALWERKGREPLKEIEC